MNNQKNELWTLLDSDITHEELELFVSDSLEPNRAAKIEKMAESSSLLHDMIAEMRREFEEIPKPAGPNEAWLRHALDKYSPEEFEESLFVGVVTADLFKIALEEAKARDFPEDVVARIESKLQRRAFRQLVEAARTNVTEKLNEMKAVVAGAFTPMRYTGPVFTAGMASTQEELVPLNLGAKSDANVFEVYADPEIKKVGFAKAGKSTIQVNIYPKQVAHPRILHLFIPGSALGEIQREVKSGADSVKVSTEWPGSALKEIELYIWFSDLSNETDVP